MTATVPESERSDSASSIDDRNDSNVEARLQEVESRLAQVLEATAESREASYRVFLFLGAIIAAAILSLIGYFVYESVTSKNNLPESIQYVPVPIEIDGKPAVIGVRVESWELPDGANLIEQRAQEIVIERSKSKANDE